MLEEEEVLVDYEEDEAQYEFTPEELARAQHASDANEDAFYEAALEEPMPRAPSMQLDPTPEPVAALTKPEPDSENTLADLDSPVEDWSEQFPSLLDRLSGPLTERDQDADDRAAKRGRYAELAPGWRPVWSKASREMSYYNDETGQTVFFKPLAHRYIDGQVATDHVKKPSKGHTKRAREAQRRALVAMFKAESASQDPDAGASARSSSSQHIEEASLQQQQESGESTSYRACPNNSDVALQPSSPDTHRKRRADYTTGNNFSRGPTLFLGDDMDAIPSVVVKGEYDSAREDVRPVRSAPLASRHTNGTSEASSADVDRMSVPKSAFPPAKQVVSPLYSPSDSSLTQDAQAVSDVFTFRVEHVTEV